METEIKTYVVAQLLKKAPLPPGVDLDGYRYLDKGHIDSLSLIKFIGGIEDHFNIELSPEDTQSDEFRTVGGLVSLIAQRMRD